MKKIIAILVFMVGVAYCYAQPFPLDYSYVGYHMSQQPIPNADVKVYVGWHDGDQSSRIQKAIDYVASLKPDKKTGLRGAILLGKGRFELSEPLRINTSGVVIRGTQKGETFLLKKGVDRGAVVYIEGKANRTITDTIHGNARKGDDVIIVRKSTQKWINLMKCGNFGGGLDLGYWGWHPGEADLEFTRKIAGVVNGQQTFDAPLPISYDKDCIMLRYNWSGRIENSGIENITIESDYNKSYPKDEDHAWNGVYLANAKDCWVRMINFMHLSGSAVVIQRSGSQITVEDCKSLAPVSEIGGYRRRTFLTFGEKCLFQRLYSEHGINDFAAGYIAAGPNAFVQCDSYESLGFSGSVGSFASGLLFDDVNIDGNDIKLCNLGIEKYGIGWNSTNSTVYQSTASGIFADSLPDGSNNYVYGCWAQFCGTGAYDESNNHVKPWSLFAEQLKKRLGRDVNDITRTLERNTDASSSPTAEQAKVMIANAKLPRITMRLWIDSAKFVANVSPAKSKNVDAIKTDKKAEIAKYEYSIVNGKLLVNGSLLVGGRHNSPWWNGRVKYSAFPKLPYAVTRFVPGMEMYGTTDRIDSVVQNMKRDNNVLYSQNYGLWYDRRRDDHERVRRRDGDVWGPFYEQPFARSGKDTAWDGLSKYDLSRQNEWYFYRLNKFADCEADNGMILMNQHYFQHNILEAGAHWVDCPWRSANNINGTEFPEPVPFTGDKRIFMADNFYDVNNSHLRELHRNYIYGVLDAFANKPNVIHSIGEEFTGPYKFVKFWLQTVSEWEQQNHKKVLVSLAVNKDVQDSIMQDKDLAKTIDIINIEQWFYNSRGLYAPKGGMNLAPRQAMRNTRAGGVSFADVYRSVSECRTAWPDKAVMYYANSYTEMAWAVLMAGGSCPDIPVKDKQFLHSVAAMQPSFHKDNVYMISGGKDAVAYIGTENNAIKVSISKGIYDILEIDSKSGELKKAKTGVSIDGNYLISSKGIYWLRKR